MVLQELCAVAVLLDEDEEEYGEGEQRGATVAEERKRDADDRHQTENHTDVDEKMDEKYAYDRVAVEACEGGALAFGELDEPEEEGEIEYDECGATDEAPLLADGAEDEVGFLLGDKVGLGDGAFEEALAEEAARADGNLGLVDVVADALEVLRFAEQDVDAFALVGFEHFLEGEIDREDEQARDDEDDGGVDVGLACAAVEPEEKIGQTDGQNDGHDDILVEHQRKHKEDDGHAREDKHIPGEPLAEERDDEGREHERGAGVVLQQYQHGRDENERQRGEAAFGAVDFHVEAACVFGQSQSGGELGELGGLEAEEAEVDPRLAAIDGDSEEYGQHEQGQGETVDDVGGVGEDARLDVENYERDNG